jgi:hypothetical protein
MSKGGFARAAQALAPRVAQSLFKIDRSTLRLSTGRIPYFDIRHSLFDIRYSLFQSFFFDQTGRFGGADT